MYFISIPTTLWENSEPILSFSLLGFQLDTFYWDQFWEQNLMIHNCIKYIYDKNIPPKTINNWKILKNYASILVSNMCGSKKTLSSPLINDEIDTVYLPFMAIWVAKLWREEYRIGIKKLGIPYASYYNPLLIWNRSWKQTHLIFERSKWGSLGCKQDRRYSDPKARNGKKI